MFGLETLLKVTGLSNLSPKFIVEIFAKKIIEHCGHPVERFDAILYMEQKRFEFLVYFPVNSKSVLPPSYLNPDNQFFKGKLRPEVPNGARLYDMDLGDAITTINRIVEMQVKDFTGKVDFLKIFVDRNSKEIPCEIFYTDKDGKRTKIKHVLK